MNHEKEDIKQYLNQNNHLNLWKEMIYDHCYVIRRKFYTLINTRVNLALNNGIYACNFSKNLQKPIIQEVITYFQAQSLPFIWILNQSSFPIQLSEELLNSGFESLFTELGMVLYIPNPQNNSIVSNFSLEIKEVDSIETSKDFAEASIRGFGLPKAVCYKFYMNYPICSFNVKRVIAYYNEAPIGVGLVLLKETYAVLYNIAVIPEYRNQGVGTRIILDLVKLIKETGRSWVLLHSSYIGEESLSKIGFYSI